MTEHEWLVCEDPFEMWLHLERQGPSNRRKARLFAAACGRIALARLSPGGFLLSAIAVAEAYADGACPLEEMVAARSVLAGRGYRVTDHSRPASLAWVACWPEILTGVGIITRHEVPSRVVQCDLLREIMGNPFRPVVSWRPHEHLLARGWWERRIQSMARTICDERDYDALPILADALSDAGCPDGDLLQHLRTPGPHVRGCWALDLLLGKE